MLGLLCCLPNFHFCWCCSWCSFSFPKRAIFMFTCSLWAVFMPFWSPTQQTGLLQMTTSANVKLLLLIFLYPPLDKIYYLFGCLSCIFHSFLTVAIKSPSVLWENHDCRPLCGWARCGWHLLVSWFLKIGKLGALFVCLLGFGFILVFFFFSSLSVEFFLVLCVLWFNYVVNILDSVIFLRQLTFFFHLHFNKQLNWLQSGCKPNLLSVQSAFTALSIQGSVRDIGRHYTQNMGFLFSGSFFPGLHPNSPINFPAHLAKKISALCWHLAFLYYGDTQT